MSDRELAYVFEFAGTMATRMYPEVPTGQLVGVLLGANL